MTFSPDAASPEANFDQDALLTALRRKEGNWVAWGEACQALRQAGLSDQHIFEATGFESVHQNQLMVGAQVYRSIREQLPATAQAFFDGRGSDLLHELRVLPQADRVAAASYLCDHQVDLDGAKELVKAIKDFGHSKPPDAFTNHPGDALAFQAWKTARQTSDLQARSLLIARGLKYAHSPGSRQAIEQLLTDFATVPARSAPRLPIYRLETDEELPRIVPIVGKLPLSKRDLDVVPLQDEIPPFGMVQFEGAGAWVALPGWQVIRTAEDPVAFLADSDILPTPLPGPTEEVLVIVDRAQRQWDPESYVLTGSAEQLALQWFETSPDRPLLGRVILIMRPKKVLDETYTQELWRLDE